VTENGVEILEILGFWEILLSCGSRREIKQQAVESLAGAGE
jgi:hypothetical protein